MTSSNQPRPTHAVMVAPDRSAYVMRAPVAAARPPRQPCTVCSDGRSGSICICTHTTESRTGSPRLRPLATPHTHGLDRLRANPNAMLKQQNSQSSCESAPWATLQHSSSPPCPLCPTSHVRSKKQRRDHKDDAWALEIRSAQLCVAQGTAPLFLHHCGSPSQPKHPVKP